MSKKLSVQDKMAYARQVLHKKMPYLTTAVLSLVPRECPGLGTFAVTDQMLLLYDPEKVEEWDIEELVFTLAHEVGHIIRNHLGRAKVLGIDPTSEKAKYFNIAGDICINWDLMQAGLPPYEHDPTYSKYGLEPNMTVEEVYRWLLQNKDKLPQTPDKCCGSGSGHKHEKEAAFSNDKKKRTASDVVRVRKQTAEAIKEHAQKKGRGSVPGGWLKWADSVLAPPTIAWNDQFARVFRKAYEWKAGNVDLKFQNVSRRQAGIGFGAGKPVLPKMMSPRPDVHIVVDTSASMGKVETEQALSEMNGIIRAVGAQVEFMAVDCAVNAVTKITKVSDAKNYLKGGGGTDFRPIFGHYKKSQKRPQIIVILTDGGGPAPKDNPLPGTEVICVLCGQLTHEPCDWWRYIYVDKNTETKK